MIWLGPHDVETSQSPSDGCSHVCCDNSARFIFVETNIMPASLKGSEFSERTRDVHADWENNTDPTWSCPRDGRLSASLGNNWWPPWNTQYITALSYRGVKGGPSIGPNFSFCLIFVSVFLWFLFFQRGCKSIGDDFQLDFNLFWSTRREMRFHFLAN